MLRETGVDTVKELKYPNPERLAMPWPTSTPGENSSRCCRHNRAVVRWIEHAKRLQLKIRYK